VVPRLTDEERARLRAAAIKANRVRMADPQWQLLQSVAAAELLDRARRWVRTGPEVDGRAPMRVLSPEEWEAFQNDHHD
jgi:hypothetical protein